MTDSVSDYESSFDFIDDTNASDGELEQVILPETSAQSEVRRRTSHVGTPAAGATAPAKSPSTATNRIKGILLFLILVLLCVVFVAHLCSLIKDLKQQHDLRASKISATKLREDQIIEELEKVKSDLQKVIDRAMKDRKNNFKNIKCLEDIPEELMDKWTPDESKFEGPKEIESSKTVNHILRRGRPVFSKVCKGQKIIQLIDYEISKALMVDNRKYLSMKGSCTYTLEAPKRNYGQVFVKEGLLYIILGATEKEQVKLVYSMPEEYL